MTKRRFRAAAVQTLARLGDYDHNIELATKYVEDAVRQGAELVVFPECMDTGYLFDSVEHCRALAEVITDGPFVKALSALSKKHSIYVASGRSTSLVSQRCLLRLHESTCPVPRMSAIGETTENICSC